MGKAFTKRNHYNPCFWTALWNKQYFEDWGVNGKTNLNPREQIVFALNLRADRVLSGKVENLHYSKNLGVAEITPESMKRVFRRWAPQDYERLISDVDRNPASLYLDFEDILTGVEKVGGYPWLMRAAQIGGVESAMHKGFLLVALIIHAMRSHELMTSMLHASSRGKFDKWEYFWLLKNAWSNPLVLARALTPLAMGEWTFYLTDDHCFPLCDSPVMIQRDTLMVILSPRLLLEINLNVARPEDHWNMRHGIDSHKYRQFRRRAISNSFKEIIFNDPKLLEVWRQLREYKKRVRELNEATSNARCVHKAASRVVWALGGFGRVPDGFETWARPYFDG